MKKSLYTAISFVAFLSLHSIASADMPDMGTCNRACNPPMGSSSSLVCAEWAKSSCSSRDIKAVQKDPNNYSGASKTCIDAVNNCWNHCADTTNNCGFG